MSFMQEQLMTLPKRLFIPAESCIFKHHGYIQQASSVSTIVALTDIKNAGPHVSYYSITRV
ncbi:hypothetical protein [uncultured Shewanella sp.]|uniref:hypothetical protein n=1 Tax=uncultured Shewanella sp. TaxID=173975 RepID=UPI00260CE644|nr:hypothetical protein [uncultured Shewanella sp.]